MGNQIPWMEGLIGCLFATEMFFLVLKFNRFALKCGHWYFI